MAAKIVTLCSALLFVFVFVSGDQKTITADPGQDVTLTCRAPNNNISIVVVKYSRADLESEYVLLYRDGHFFPDEQHPSFKNRVDLQDTQMKDGNVSLILKDVTVNDTGTYKCHVAQKEPNLEKAVLKLLSNITLRVVAPPGPTGGTSEDGGKKDGSVGLMVGLSVPAVLVVVVVVVVVGFVIYKKHKQNQDPYHLPV